MMAWSDILRQVGDRLRQDDRLGPGSTVIVILALVMVQAALPVAAAVLLGDLVDALADAGVTTSVFPMMAIWGGLLLLMVPTAALATYLMNVFAVRLQAHLSAIVLAKATQLDLATLEAPDVQDELFRAQQEATRRIPSLLSALLSVATGVTAVAALLIALFAIVPAVAALLLLPVVLLTFAAVGWPRVRQWHHLRAQLMRQLRYLQRLLTEPRAAGELRVFGLGGVFLMRSAALWQDVMTCQARIARWVCRADMMINGGVVVGLTGGAFYAVTQSIDGALSVGTVVMVIQLQLRIHATAKGLQQGLALLATNGTDVEPLRRFLALKPMKSERTPPVPGPRVLADGIRFEDVSFRYAHRATDAVRRLTLTLCAGQTVAIVGPNGSGKSTLLKLLCRLYDPTQGRIVWDETDLRDFDIAALRARMTVAFQDAQRYEFDVRDNIALGSPVPLSDAELVRAARAAGADQMIAELPHQYDTRVGSLRRGAVELSGGQWQTLALARTMTRDTPLVLLDEPNQNLDPEAEAALFGRLQALMTGRTAVIVSHRLSVARCADEIIVMDQGTAVERGTHARLVAAGGLYQHMFTRQAKGYL